MPIALQVGLVPASPMEHQLVCGQNGREQVLCWQHKGDLCGWRCEGGRAEHRNEGNETALNQADLPPPARRSREGAGERRGL